MTTREMMEGQCLCGAVSITAKAVNDVEACHCGMCQRWGGGPFLALHCDSGVEVSGNANVTIFNSSEWAERAFCNTCGTHLYYRLKPADAYMVPAGSFAGQDGFTLKEQIFIDRKPSYYDFAGDIPALTEKEVFQKYAPK